MPVTLRLQLARFALWRLKHGVRLAPSLFLLILLIGSGALGYGLAQQHPWSLPVVHASMNPTSVPVNQPAVAGSPSLVEARMAREIGRLQSEIVALRVLFLRLADVAQLDDGEFDLDMDFAPLSTDSGLTRSSESGAKPVLAGALGDRASRAAAFVGPVSWTDAVSDSDERSPYPTGFPASAGGAGALPLAKRALVHMSEQAARLASIYHIRRLAHDFRISGLPVEQPVISSRYGYRLDPISGRRQMHRGLDFAGEQGSRITAVADGIVTWSGRNGGYGNLVELEHGNGFRTRYAHVESLLVPLGAYVRKGQVIATMGSSGRSTGTHLHLEVRRHGSALDPQQYLR